MDAIHWPVLGVSPRTPKEFVPFWGRFYSGFNEDFYRGNIGRPLTKERIVAWFDWKNGAPLAPKQVKAVRRFFSPEERIGHDADAAALGAFLNRPGGAIWRIFWLHLQHPGHFPIYDQHVQRAMAFMLKRPDLTIPVYNPTKVRIYLEDYRPFFDRFGDCERRQVDRALWSFGRFLKSEYRDLVTPPTH